MNPIPMPVHSQRRKLNQELRVPSWLEDGGRARLNPRQPPPGPPRVRDSWVNMLAPVFLSLPLSVSRAPAGGLGWLDEKESFPVLQHFSGGALPAFATEEVSLTHEVTDFFPPQALPARAR